MIRGISFKVSQDQDRILSEIFQGIDVSKYIWYNIQSQNEAWCRRDNEILDKTFLKKSRYRGQEFLERIREKHFIVFLKLEAFEEETADYEVHSYKEQTLTRDFYWIMYSIQKMTGTFITMFIFRTAMTAANLTHCFLPCLDTRDCIFRAWERMCGQGTLDLQPRSIFRK